MIHFCLLLLVSSVLGLPALPGIIGGPSDLWPNLPNVDPDDLGVIPDDGVIGGPDDLGPFDPDTNSYHDLWPDVPYPDGPEGPLDYFSRKNMTSLHRVTDRALIGNANDYVDKLLVKVSEMMLEKGYDPYPLPEKTLAWEQHLIFITISAAASLYNGHVTGLSLIKRAGDVTLESIAQRFLVTASLGTAVLEAGYNMRVQLMGLGPNCSVSISIQEPEIMSRIEVPIKGGEPKLSYFEVTHLGKVTWDFKCGTLVDVFLPVVEIAVNFAANLVKNFVAKVIEGPLKDFLEKQIQLIAADFIN